MSPALTRSCRARLTVLRENCKSEAIVFTAGQQSDPFPARSQRYIYKQPSPDGEAHRARRYKYGWSSSWEPPLRFEDGAAAHGVFRGFCHRDMKGSCSGGWLQYLPGFFVHHHADHYLRTMFSSSVCLSAYTPAPRAWLVLYFLKFWWWVKMSEAEGCGSAER